ncbi:hypothetical protein [Nocardia sp. NPDC004860]|uniref:hypothetical protein n=1 Tax=Nocardia sp. NPDC004860 TaxID=3154557 RepID=UPI0033BA2D62
MTARHNGIASLSVAGLAALMGAGGVVAAGPGRADAGPPVHYTVSAAGDSVRAFLDGGAFAVAADGESIEVRDNAGLAIDAIPLTVFLGEERVPMTQHIDSENRTLTLTPDVSGVPAAALQPIGSPIENQLALTDLANNLSRGPLIGTAIGMAVGAVIGGVLGLSTCAVVGPACVATVPAAVLVFSGAGGLAGTLVGGGAGLIDGVRKYLITLQSAPGESPYAHNGLVDPDGTGVPDAILRVPSGSSSGLRSGSSGGSSHR